MIKVVLTKIPLRYLSYFHYLILGFYELSGKGEIKLEIRPEKFYDRIRLRFFRIDNKLRKSIKWLKKFPYFDYCLTGYISFNKKKIKFCYDIADCPYYFDPKQLYEVDIYFKAQCPKVIKDEGFYLTDKVVIPYNPETLLYKNKIKPSMLGPGFQVGNIFSFKKLKKEYQKLFINNGEKKGILMCYFGNSKGPKPRSSQNPDLFNNDSDILGHYGDRISHPNEKRTIAAELISKMGPSYDGRVINDGNSDTSEVNINSQLFIPIQFYSAHIARFHYNLNISGNRMSIPYRFIFSFAVGTGIVTDELSVKWYRPFGKEVIETVQMGYLPSDQVDWSRFTDLIENLPQITEEEVKKEFNEKWTPEVFARYIVETCISSIL